MAEKKVKITFEVDGIQQTVNSVEELENALKDTGKAAKDAGEEATIFGDIKGKFNDAIAPLKKVIASMRTLKGAIAATGIGALLVALGSLVAYFKSSEEGSRKLAIATETLSVLFGKLTEFASGVGEKLSNAFSNPKEALLDFGKALVDNVITRFKGILNFLPSVGKALSAAFKGNFKEAGTIAANALGEIVLGTENVVEKTVELGKSAVKVYKEEIVPAVREAIDVATELVDRTRALRDQQQELTVQNAELNRELELQQRIAEDTTLSYDERKAALDRVAEAQVALAANVAEQAKNEEALLQLQIETANSYEEREELETQLAEATAARIEAETQLGITKQEVGKIGRELDQEEIDRKKSLNDILAELDLESIENEFEKARQELAIQEQAALDELNLLGATEDQKQKVRDAFAKKRMKLTKEESDFNKKIDQEELAAKLQVASSAFSAIAQIAGEQSAVGKAAAVANATINTYLAATNALANTPAPPPFPQIAAGVAIASGLLQVQKILSTPEPDIPGGGGGSRRGGAAPSISAPQAPQFDPQAALEQAQGNQDAGPDLTLDQGSSTIKAYVVAEEMTTQQEANKKIDDLAKL